MRYTRALVEIVSLVLAAAGVVVGQGATYTFSTLAGSPSSGVSDGTGAAASFASPSGLAYLNNLIYETDATLLRTVTPAGVVKKLAQLVDLARAVAVDPTTGIAYVAAGCGIAQVTADGTVTTLAGNVLSTQPGACGSNDGIGTSPRFNLPAGIAVRHPPSSSAFVFVADTGNSTIRQIQLDGQNVLEHSTTTTISGVALSTGTADGNGTAVRFNAPAGLAVNSNGELYIADTGNHTIRHMTILGDVTTVAGLAGSPGSADGTGTAARFNAPRGLAVDASDNLFIADSGNSTVRKMVRSGSVGSVSTIAGAAGAAGTTDGSGAAARFNAPRGIALDGVGTIYVADTANQEIRQGVLGAAAAPSITTQPTDRTITSGETGSFFAMAGGNPSPGFQWQVSTNGTTWSDLSEAPPYRGTRSSLLVLENTPGSLSGRRYRVIVANPSGTATSNAVTLTVNALVVSPASLRFTAAKNGAAGDITASTPPQDVAVVFTGQTSTWSASSNQAWLQITRANGSGAGRFTATLVNPGNVIGGSTSLTATITVTSPSGLAATLPVTLVVDLTNPHNPPFGSFDTPANNATGLHGSIAVTGWALDDIGVDHVEIWRDAATGETTPVFTGAGPGNGKIYVGNAVFVSGARPDVEAAYPTMPNAQAAGWGYLLFTYGLWNQGNGTYRLYAFAIDVDGSWSPLGSKTIAVDNVNATKPFGAIDTPGFGGTVSGGITNFGWALTPGSSCSIANPNVKVSIDSGPAQSVSYGDARSDIAGAFPGYTNAAAAGGHFTFDTTTLTNGLHTIGWLVTDSCGRADGVGSRFFNVANSASIATDATPLMTRALESRPASGRGTTRVVRVEQNGRIEVPLPGDERYVAGALPLGSTFDAATNTFMWQPAAGFLGAYDLRFVPGEAGSYADPVTLRIIVGPPIRLAIDTPHTGNVLSASRFAVAGWAVDLASFEGAGIDTLHVWAYPVAGGVPLLVGVAKPGGRRPDVARLYGVSFTASGFTLEGTLPPGTYDLVAYAHNAASGTFSGANLVRVLLR